MRPLALALLLLAPSAAAQTRIGVSAGATFASALVRDSITEPLTVRSAPGPSATFSLDTRLNAAYRVGLSLATTWGPLREHTPGGSRDVVQLVAWHPAVTLRRDIGPFLSAYATAGAMVYRPDRTAGTLFGRGSPIVPVIGFGLGLEKSAGPRLTLTVDAGYDAHRFTTTALRDNGFIGERVVHRLVVSVGAKRAL